MAVNFPGPAVADITYSYSGITHHQQLNFTYPGELTAGMDLADVDVTTRSGSYVPVLTAVTAWITLIKSLYNTGVKFDSVTVWKYTAGTYDRLFINSAVLDIDGTSASAAQLAAQYIYTFRTTLGGVMKLSFMETVAAPGASASRAAATGNVLAIFQFVEGLTNWVVARDNGFPIAGIASHPGQNEALFKRRYRTL